MVAWGHQGVVGNSTKFGLNAGINAGSDAANIGAGASLGAAVSPLMMGTEGGGLSPVTVIIGLALLLFGLKVIGEHGKTEINPAHFHIGAYNILTVTVTSIVGTVILKWLFNRWHVPGVTDVVNAV